MLDVIDCTESAIFQILLLEYEISGDQEQQGKKDEARDRDHLKWLIMLLTVV